MRSPDFSAALARPQVAGVLVALALAVLAVLTRLPQFLSPYLALDGDEAVVGLMAEHLRNGGEFSLFFWGQRYGIAAPEAALIASFFAGFGTSTVALKAAMLAFWVVAGGVVALSVRSFAGGRAALIAATFLILCPAWMEWALQARGGYHLAFLFAHAAVWLIAVVSGRSGPERVRLVVLGVALALVFFGQPLWIPPLVPFLILLGYSRRRLVDFAFVGVGGAAAGLLIRAFGSGVDYWSPPVPSALDLMHGILDLPRRVWIHFTGFYYYDAVIPPPLFTKIAAGLWCGLLLAAVGAPFVVRGRHRPVLAACAAAVATSLALATVSTGAGFMPRYLLPLAGFVVTSQAIVIADFWRRGGGARRLASLVVALVVLAGAGAAPEFGTVSLASPPRERPVAEEAAIRALIDELTRRGVRHVYTLDPTLQWILTFQSGERIICRWRDPRDRYPAYPQAVDVALLAGKPVALVGDVAEAAAMRRVLPRVGAADLSLLTIADRYFAILDPSPGLLRGLGFRINGLTPNDEAR